MNPILIPPKWSYEEVPLNHGSGRYYAQFSQVERLSDAAGELYPAIWVLEAFDSQWFEMNPLPATPDGLTDYYTRALLFVLELKVETPTAWRLNRLSTIHEANAGEEGEPEDWFLVIAEPLGGRALDEGEVLLTIYPNLYLAGIPASLVEAGPVDPETSARLKRAVSTAHILDATEQEVDNALTGVAGASIDWAVTYDVGQGDSIGLCEPKGSVKAYFDLGGGVNGNAKTFPTALTHFCFTQQPPIILSHWDFDHWSSANRDTRSHGMTWIAPRQAVGPTHLALMTNITSAGKLLLVPTGGAPTWPKGFIAKWRGQLYLELCTGKGRNHSGLALTLSEKASGGGEQMLFPGDARYTHIPSFPNPPTSQYLSVVAPHHGGDMRSRTAPVCPSHAASRLIYSYGLGNTFSHPRNITRTDHDTNGWRDPLFTSAAFAYEVRETASRGKTLFGHVLLGWKTCAAIPALTCSGAACQLEAQQL
jgi:hypothetical protein